MTNPSDIQTIVPNGTDQGAGIESGTAIAKKTPAAPNRLTPSNAVQNQILADIQKQQEDLLEILSQQSRLRRLWLKIWKKRPPELVKVYGVIYSHLAEIQRILLIRQSNPQPGSQEIEKHLSPLLGKGLEDIRSLNIHGAWEYAASLERLLLLLGDEKYVHARLMREAQREATSGAGSWSAYLEKERLTQLLEVYKTGNQVAAETGAQAIECLAFLSTRRSQYLRDQRATEEMKASYLNRLTLILSLLLLLMLQGIYLTSDGGAASRMIGGFGGWLLDILTLQFWIDLNTPLVRNAVIAAVTGALGSTLSGFYKLRDEVGGVATLRAFRSAMLAQPFVGAVVGVLLLVFVGSDILNFVKAKPEEGASWALLSIYSFIAGFSEPFFLGTVRRVAGAAEKKHTGDAVDKKP